MRVGHGGDGCCSLTISRACPAAAAILPAHHVWRSRRPAVGRQGPEPIGLVASNVGGLANSSRKLRYRRGDAWWDAESRVLALATHDRSERAVPGRVAPATATAGKCAEGAVERCIRRQPQMLTDRRDRVCPALGTWCCSDSAWRWDEVDKPLPRYPARIGKRPRRRLVRGERRLCYRWTSDHPRSRQQDGPRSERSANYCTIESGVGGSLKSLGKSSR
jgi:hypothetical protein